MSWVNVQYSDTCIVGYSVLYEGKLCRDFIEATRVEGYEAVRGW